MLKSRAEIIERKTTPRAYFACLESYNAGTLHGAWIDATDKDEIWDGIKEMLATSPVAGAEEWAIHDYEGFGELHISEHLGVDMLAALGKAIEKHGELFSKYLHNSSSTFNSADDVETLEASFEDSYSGEFDSKEDWAEMFLEDCGMLQEIPKELRSYFDFEKYARDVTISGDMEFIRHGGKVHAFNPNL